MSDTRPKSWWFGCWLKPGHHLVGEDGQWESATDCPLYRCDGALDGGYAPRKIRYRHALPIAIRDDGLVFSQIGGDDSKLRHDIMYRSDELPQGQALWHGDVRGCTLLSWWDRTQGDTRGNCNSTFIVAGHHHANDMMRMFSERFPRQAQRLKDAGVELVVINLGIP